MKTQIARNTDRLLWLVVLLVGVIVLLVVFGLQLYPRLNAGQQLLNDARPVFTEERVDGDQAGITMVSSVVDMADPIGTTQGGAAAEVPQLITFVSQQTGLPEADVLATLQQNFPHTTALLQAIPLEAVTTELPGLTNFLATTLKLTPEQVTATLQENFPRITQAITALPAVTNGWNNIPGTEELTRFNGDPVTTVPQLRDYLSQDVIPVLERQDGNFRRLDQTWPPLSYIPPLLTILGIIVVVFGGLMMLRSAAGDRPRAEATVMWSVVAAVGVIVLLVVFGLQLYPRLNAGQQLLNDARPVFTEERVDGDQAGINFVSAAVDLVDPVGTTQGGAAAEVPQLITFVSQQTGLPEADVLATLQQNFPHTTALLQAIPLEAVTTELPGLTNFLATTLKLTPEQVTATLQENFPRITQAITALPAVTNGWNNIPGTEELTRFNGDPVTTVPQLRDYLSQDVIPVLERQDANFRRLDQTWPPVTYFPPLLTIVGLIVLVYGLVMVWLARGREPAVA